MNNNNNKKSVPETETEKQNKIAGASLGGAIFGGSIGGPAGAIIGGTAGYLIGSVIVKKNKEKKGGKNG